MAERRKHLVWLGTTDRDYATFPQEVKMQRGNALNTVQHGGTPRVATPLHGFGGAHVLELRDDYVGDTYRVVYTIRFRLAVYVVDAFQKKSHRGSAVPREIRIRIRQRLAYAERHYRDHFEAPANE